MGAVTVAVRLQWWKRSGLLSLAFGTVIPGVKLITHRETAGMGSIRGVLSSTYWKWPLDGPQLRHSGEAKEQERRVDLEISRGTVLRWLKKGKREPLCTERANCLFPNKGGKAVEWQRERWSTNFHQEGLGEWGKPPRPTRHHCEEQVCDGDVGKMEERNSTSTAEMHNWRLEGGDRCGKNLRMLWLVLAHGVSEVVRNSSELMQMQWWLEYA